MCFGSMPSGKLEHLTPKIERVTGCAEDCAETLYWPIARLFVPGEGGVACNSLCDYIVRFVGALVCQMALNRSTFNIPSAAFESEAKQIFGTRAFS